jgi:phospholipid/cholesterol/gamma-HCH transport system permease protein
MTARDSFQGALAAIGSFALGRMGRVPYLAAVTYAVVRLAARRRTWRRTVRDVLARQILYTGVEATPFTTAVAFLVGISIVVQAQLWVRKVGQSQLLGPLLVAVIVRELGPLLVNMILIGRSGNAMAAELGHMKFSGEVRVLDAQGLDPLVYLVVPRVMAMMVCSLCLTIIFIVVSFFSGYLFGVLLGAQTGRAQGFLDSVAGSLGPVDLLNVVAKSLLPGLLAGVICCVEGLSVGTTITDIPQAITRSVQQSVVALFFTSAAISLATYV